MKFLSRSTLKYLLIFALAGPPIAALFLMVWADLTTEFPRDWTVGSWLSVLAGLSFFAYVWGFLPALLSGAAAAYLRILVPGLDARARSVRLAGTVAIGAVASWILPQVYPGGDSGFDLAVLGLGSAFVCACWVEWRARPDASSESSPLHGSA